MKKPQPKIMQEEPTLEYVVYKDEAERIIRKLLRNDDFTRSGSEVFMMETETESGICTAFTKNCLT